MVAPATGRAPSVADLNVRYLSYDELKAKHKTIVGFGHGIKTFQAISCVLVKGALESQA